MAKVKCGHVELESEIFKGWTLEQFIATYTHVIVADLEDCYNRLMEANKLLCEKVKDVS